MKKELNVFDNAVIEEWSGRYILGQRCKILLNACHKDRWLPECSAIILEYWADFAFDICLLQRCICLLNLDLFRAVGYLRQTRSSYPRCLLEARMAGVIHGSGGLGEVFLVASGAWKSTRVLRTLSYCWASSVALDLGFLIKSELLMSALKASTIDTSMPMAGWCYGFIDLAVERWFDCCATEAGYEGILVLWKCACLIEWSIHCLTAAIISRLDTYVWTIWEIFFKMSVLLTVGLMMLPLTLRLPLMTPQCN